MVAHSAELGTSLSTQANAGVATLQSLPTGLITPGSITSLSTLSRAFEVLTSPLTRLHTGCTQLVAPLGALAVDTVVVTGASTRRALSGTGKVAEVPTN